LRKLDNYLRAGKAKSFARAVVLLCLMGHTSLVTMTHHHGGAQPVSLTTSCSVEANTGGDSNGPPETSRDTCCMSCCLLRNFVNSISPVSIPTDLCPEAVTPEAFVLESSSNGVILVLSNRAPPLA
jgi:hypothetical protein